MGKAGKRKEMVKDWGGVSCVWKSKLCVVISCVWGVCVCVSKSYDDKLYVICEQVVCELSCMWASCVWVELCVSKLSSWQVVWWEVVCVMTGGVSGVWGRRREEEEKAAGYRTKNKNREPHTKMWGKMRDWRVPLVAMAKNMQELLRHREDYPMMIQRPWFVPIGTSQSWAIRNWNDPPLSVLVYEYRYTCK